MTTNHLQEAKTRMDKSRYEKRFQHPTETEREEAKVHALIAIAEEIELTGKGLFAGLSGIDKRINAIAEQLKDLTRGMAMIAEARGLIKKKENKDND